MKTCYSRMLLAGAAVVLAQAALAEDKPEVLGGTIGGSVKFATDYVFRGESETVSGEIPAVQASLTWTHSSGVYLGYFGSTNKFEGSPDIYAVVGPYLGKYGSIGESGFNYNVMAFSYQYPGANRYNYSELYMYLDRNFGPVNLKLEVTPTLDDWFGVDGWKGVNYAIHPKLTLGDGWGIDGSFGYQELTGHGAEGWKHWNAGVTKSMWGLNFDLRYHDTDIDRSHKVYGSHDGRKIFKERVVFAVSKSF
ncbi:TorF family putative porin [Aromatoleum toluclasticum]|uniref:TorF family putative porin n=1 Tax=Aromatoleum toluclasticum TaxID=92003 RepID=UPI001D191B8F|nr:TorF family putative porin [Aromatoleum toluclasticum]MCC4114240.1 TorF family putative porin [Aromatoleum toluclasticum]